MMQKKRKIKVASDGERKADLRWRCSKNDSLPADRTTGTATAGPKDSSLTKLFPTSASDSLKRLPQPSILIQAAAGKLAWATCAGETWFVHERGHQFSAAESRQIGA